MMSANRTSGSHRPDNIRRAFLAKLTRARRIGSNVPEVFAGVHPLFSVHARVFRKMQNVAPVSMLAARRTLLSPVFNTTGTTIPSCSPPYESTVVNSIWYTATSRQMEDRRRGHWRKRAATLPLLAPPLSLPPASAHARPAGCRRARPIRLCSDAIRWQASRVRPDSHQVVARTPN
jgi:hypothetical protein